MPYIVRDKDFVYATYSGFSPFKGKTGRIALAFFDGEPDLYDIDDDADLAVVVDEINRKYNDDYSRFAEIVIYSKVKG